MNIKYLSILVMGLFIGIISCLLFPEAQVNFYFYVLINSITFYLLGFGNIKLMQISLNICPRHKYRFRHLLALLPLSIILSFSLLLLREYSVHLLAKMLFEVHIDNLLLLSFVFSFFIVTLIEGIDFFRHWKDYVIRTEQIEKANLLAQYETLRNQVNPHFLFNGLNTLISFIENNDKRAAQFAQNLSDFLKYLLTYHKDELISLEQELAVVKQYIYLQRSRFDENLMVSIKYDNKYANRQIPPLALQMLIENAIKHNKISSTNKLQIDIYIENDYIFVKNNIQLKTNVNSAKVGIENITGRYNLFTEKEIYIEKNDVFYLIGIPLLM